MFFFLYGEDTYRSSRKAREIVDGYEKVHKTGLNLIYFDCENSDFDEFQNVVQSVSMFQEKKLIILRNAFLNIIFKEKFLDWAKSRFVILNEAKRSEESDNIIVIYENQAIKKTDKLFKFLKANARAQEFSFLVGVKLQNWIDKEFEKYNAKIELLARAKLIDFVGSDLWQMSQEIRKLSAYVLHRHSERSEESRGIIVDTASRAKQRDSSVASRLPQNDSVSVASHDVQLLVIPKIETDIFKTIDAIAQNNKTRALLLLREHLAKGDAPLYLLSMINFQFRNLLVVKDYLSCHCEGFPDPCHSEGVQQNDRRISSYNAIKIPGMHPYVAQKSLAQARNFTFDKLKKIYHKLLAIDTGIKTGKVDARMALDMLIISI